MKKFDMGWASPERLEYELVNHPKHKDYMDFKYKHPEVINMFESMAVKCIKSKKTFGMWLLANKLRWDYWWDYEEDFKINNNLLALVSRDLMIKYPDLKLYCFIKKMKWANNFDNEDDGFFD